MSSVRQMDTLGFRGQRLGLGTHVGVVSMKVAGAQTWRGRVAGEDQGLCVRALRLAEVREGDQSSEDEWPVKREWRLATHLRV